MPRMSYVTVGSNDLEKAKHFYDTLLGSIGMQPAFEHPSGGRIYGSATGELFGVLGPFNGEAATAGNGTMIGFSFDTIEEMEDFHRLGIKLGGTSEGDVGERAPGVCIGYLRDLDGNKLCTYKFG